MNRRRLPGVILAVVVPLIAPGCDSPTASDGMPAELRLDKDWVIIEEGHRVELTATFFDQNGEIVRPPPEEWTITWQSSDETVASVSEGVVTGVAPGDAVITASAGGLADETAVWVRPVPTAEDVVVAMSILPDTVAPGEAFRVAYMVHNTAWVPVFLDTESVACLAYIDAYYAGEQVDFDGLGIDCVSASAGYWEIAPGATLVRVSYTSASLVTPSGVVPADPGTYTITIRADVIEINREPGELPTVSGTLTVVPAPTAALLNYARDGESPSVGR